MQIDNVRREDAGTYMCTASNNVGTMSADEIDLRILCKFSLYFDSNGILDMWYLHYSGVSNKQGVWNKPQLVHLYVYQLWNKHRGLEGAEHFPKKIRGEIIFQILINALPLA